MILKIESTMPVHFFIPGEPDLQEKLNWDPEKTWHRMRWGQWWLLQTFLRLKDAGYPVTASTDTIDNGIFIYHTNHQSKLLEKLDHKKHKNLILVSIRADFKESPLADFEILQNRWYEDKKRLFYIPHWPQPGIIPRDKSRGSQIANIAFKGFHNCLNPYFFSTNWTDWLADKDISWKLDSENTKFSSDAKISVDWHDYHDVDLVLALRRYGKPAGPKGGYSSKPGSKLYNAWFAEVPAILGPDYAYRDLRKSELDYLEIIRPEEAKKHLSFLIENPDFYQAMVENGKIRAQEFTIERVLSEWVKLLYETIPGLWQNGHRYMPRFIPFKSRKSIRYAARKMVGRRSR